MSLKLLFLVLCVACNEQSYDLKILKNGFPMQLLTKSPLLTIYADLCHTAFSVCVVIFNVAKCIIKEVFFFFLFSLPTFCLNQHENFTVIKLSFGFLWIKETDTVENSTKAWSFFSFLFSFFFFAFVLVVL